MTTPNGTSRSDPVHLNRAVAVLGFFVLLVPLCAGPIKFIAISATAAAGYVRPLDSGGKPRPETFVFTQGKFFGGNTRDTRLNQIKFDDIVKTLASNLAKQNYFPTRDVPSTDILMVVHWGVTTIFDESQNILTENINQAACSGST